MTLSACGYIVYIDEIHLEYAKGRKENSLVLRTQVGCLYGYIVLFEFG